MQPSSEQITRHLEELLDHVKKLHSSWAARHQQVNCQPGNGEAKERELELLSRCHDASGGVLAGVKKALDSIEYLEQLESALASWQVARRNWEAGQEQVQQLLEKGVR